MIKEQHRDNIANILHPKVMSKSNAIELFKSNSKTGGETQKWFITKVY
jgi:hypothetical protein